MSRKLRQKKSYPEDFKTMFGLSTLNWTETVSNAFMTGLFMLYMTDYAGIGASAAALGTILLTAGRIFDAVNDPLQGFIMDRAKPGKYGKYKPFIIISTIMITVSLCFMFSIPEAVAKSPVLVTIWFVFFYLMYDMGASFFAENPLKQSLTTNPVIRSKFTTWPRIVSMIVVIPMSFFIPILTSINVGVDNMSKSFSLLSVAFLLIAGIVSLIGIAMVKEGKHVETESEEKLSVKDVLYMFKTNKPLLISILVTVFHGFVWTLVFATTTYYTKWAYCTDLATGVVDSERLGTMTMILGIFQLFPSILMAALSPRLVKLFNGPVKVFQLSMILEMVGGLGLFVCMILGILHTTPALFFIMILIILLGAGLSFVPGTLIGIECMDYGMYRTGREMHGMCHAVNRFIGKAQTALSSALVGGILIAVGYQVDSVTDTFIGELSAIPQMLNSFILISGLAPAILCIISLFIMRFYPIDDKLRAEINAKIEKMKDGAKVKAV